MPEIPRPTRLSPIVLGLAAVLLLGVSIAAAGLLPGATPGSQPVTAQATNKPTGTEAPEAPPSAAQIHDIVGRLKAAGITTTDAAFGTLAGKYGLGGAVRILAFAHASGKTPDQIAAMFDGGKGWGQIRSELGISIGPGIGWIMGHGHAQGGAGKPDANESPEPSESPGD